MHYDGEEDGDGDWVEDDDAPVGEGVGRIRIKMKDEAAVGVGEVRAEATRIRSQRKFSFEKNEPGIMPSAATGAASPWFTGHGSATC